MKPLHYPLRPGTPWKVEIPATMSGGKRIRQFFETKEAAEAFIEKTKARVAALGYQAFSPSNPPLSGHSVEALSKMFYDDKAVEFGADYLASLRAALKRIVGKFGDRPAASLTPPEIVKWLRELPLGKTSRFNVFKIFRTFFTWVEMMDYVPVSVIRKVSPPAKGDPPKAILTVSQMQTVLEFADSIVFPAMCLGGFAGLRTDEILKLQWTDIDWEAGEVHVRPGVQKKTRGALRERYVTILPALEAWLRPRAKAEGPVIALSEKYFRERRSKLTKKLKLREWPDNCLRHSFASYHLAMWQDASKTAFQMGHTDNDMVQRHYARAVKQAEAEKWWAIAPKKAPEPGLVI